MNHFSVNLAVFAELQTHTHTLTGTNETIYPTSEISWETKSQTIKIFDAQLQIQTLLIT